MARRKGGARQELPDGSAVIDLSKEPGPDEKVDTGKPPDYGAPAAEAAAKVEVPHRPEIKSEPGERIVEADLASQVEALRKREELSRKRAEAAEQARLQAEQARQYDRYNAQAQLESSHYDNISNALAAVQGEVAQAKAELVYAKQSGDGNAEADAVIKLQRLASRMETLEGGKQELERNFQQRRQQPPPQPQQAQPGVEDVLARMPALNNAERDWIRQHPDSVLDQRKQLRMQAAYLDAEERGLERGSPEYFRFFEKRLGYEPSMPDYEEDDDMADDDQSNLATFQRPEPKRAPVAAAPVSRSSPGVSAREPASSTRVTLTPQQREAAKFSGISEREYAQNLQKLIARKRNGYYSDAG